MKKLILMLLLLVLSLPNARAQNSNADVNIKQVVNEASGAKSRDFNNGSLFTSEDLLGVFTNNAFIGGLQQGALDGQVAQIQTLGDGNDVRLNQGGGTANIGIINIMGNNNDATLDQRGSGLLSAIKIVGSANKLDVDQSGTNLQNLILLQGSSLDFDVLQTGAGIQLTQTPSGGSAIPLQITQAGGGRTIPIIIRNH